MLCSGGGCNSAIAIRCCVAWGKFSKLLPVLTSRHLSPKVRGRVCMACVCLAMLCGSETWGPNTSDLEWLCSNDHTMIRWICDTKDWMKHLYSDYSRNLSLRILQQPFSAGGWDGMDRCSVSRLVSNLSQTFHFLAQGKEDLERHGPNVSHQWMWPDWHWPARQRCLESQCSAWPGAANPIRWDTGNTLI